jgi:hypothetical protein
MTVERGETKSRPVTLKLTIHGDNVIECDRALAHIEAALDFKAEWLSGTDPRRPTLVGVLPSSGQLIEITMLPGHGRWGFDIPGTLRLMGSTIRENADAVITIQESRGERILFAMEFCGALPAGNNAWQRHGRAFSFGEAGIPYLIYNEIGGQELNADRSERAARFPNPAVPLSLVRFSGQRGVPILPVYEAAASATEAAKAPFLPAFGKSAANAFIRAMLLGLDSTEATEELEHRAMEMGLLLADRGKRANGYSRVQWTELLSGTALSDYYLAAASRWSRRAGEKVRATLSARKLLLSLQQFNPVSVGSALLPFFIIRGEQRRKLSALIGSLYGDSMEELCNWVESADGPMSIVLVTGFKPKGDDSRPDRGLVPLARMLLGAETNILTIVWGPAKADQINRIRANAYRESEANGLLQSVFSCSDMVLFDSANGAPLCVNTSGFSSTRTTAAQHLLGAISMPEIGENDVDSIFHFLTTRPERVDVLEGMCNPPGGDWSGINLRLADGTIARWTSLPRVSAAKRPDHVVQVVLKTGPIVLSVESKRTFSDLEANVGPRLVEYMKVLMTIGPGVVRLKEAESWTAAATEHRVAVDIPVYSLAIAAPIFDAKFQTLAQVQVEYDLDFVMSVAIDRDNVPVIKATSRPGLEHLLDEVIAVLAKEAHTGLKVRKD